MPRARGLSVEVLEPRAGPVDKACGEGLMPGGLAALPTSASTRTATPSTGSATCRASGSAVGGLRRRAPVAGSGAPSCTPPARRGDGRAGRGRCSPVRDRRSARTTTGSIVTTRLRGAPSGRRFGRDHVLAADGLHSWTRRHLGLDRPSGGPRPVRAAPALRRRAVVRPRRGALGPRTPRPTSPRSPPTSSGVAVLSRAAPAVRRAARAVPRPAGERLAGAEPGCAGAGRRSAAAAQPPPGGRPGAARR